MSTCRICTKADWNETEKGPLVKYGVRHYVHAECALKRWGSTFFTRLTLWQLDQFPAIYAKQAGLYDDLEKRITVLRVNERKRA